MKNNIRRILTGLRGLSIKPLAQSGTCKLFLLSNRVDSPGFCAMVQPRLYLENLTMGFHSRVCFLPTSYGMCLFYTLTFMKDAYL